MRTITKFAVATGLTLGLVTGAVAGGCAKPHHRAKRAPSLGYVYHGYGFTRGTGDWQIRLVRETRNGGVKRRVRNLMQVRLACFLARPPSEAIPARTTGELRGCLPDDQTKGVIPMMHRKLGITVAAVALLAGATTMTLAAGGGVVGGGGGEVAGGAAGTGGTAGNPTTNNTCADIGNNGFATEGNMNTNMASGQLNSGTTGNGGMGDSGFATEGNMNTRMASGQLKGGTTGHGC
jgi:hypothetical protein